MAKIDFPNDPQVNDELQVGSRTYIWDGVRWLVQGSFSEEQPETQVNFPNNPFPNQFFRINGKAYIWDGIRWVISVIEDTPTATPSVTLANVDYDRFSITLTNNDDEEAEVFYGFSQFELTNSIVLQPNETGQAIEFTNLDPETVYTVFAQAQSVASETEKVLSLVTFLEITTLVEPSFGVQWNQNTDTLTRLNESVNLTAGTDFTELESEGVWNLRRCMINNDKTINYYVDPADPSLIGEVVNTAAYISGNPANYEGSHGQVMVEIPKFYWRYEEAEPNVYQWFVSPVQIDSSYEAHPAFVTDGVTKNFIYMSAFEGTFAISGGLALGPLRSISNAKPFAGGQQTISALTFRTRIQDRGAGWQMQTYWALNALQVLYSVEYANFDSQASIGNGVVAKGIPGGANNSNNTGATISLGNASGEVNGSISYRGVENLWGNLEMWVDGINIKDNEAFVANENFAFDTFAGSYTSVGSLATSNGFASDIQFPHFLATERLGSSTSHLHDNYFQNSGDKVVVHGGFWDSQSFAGIFQINAGQSSTSTSQRIGTRIQIL